MTPGIKPLVAGNWKMNGFRNSMSELGEMANGYGAEMRGRLDMLVCVPSTLILTAAHVCLGSRVAVGGQDCHSKPAGAHTGEEGRLRSKDSAVTHHGALVGRDKPGGHQ